MKLREIIWRTDHAICPEAFLIDIIKVILVRRTHMYICAWIFDSSFDIVPQLIVTTNKGIVKNYKIDRKVLYRWVILILARRRSHVCKGPSFKNSRFKLRAIFPKKHVYGTNRPHPRFTEQSHLYFKRTKKKFSPLVRSNYSFIKYRQSNNTEQEINQSWRGSLRKIKRDKSECWMVEKRLWSEVGYFLKFERIRSVRGSFDRKISVGGKGSRILNDFKILSE